MRETIRLFKAVPIKTKRRKNPDRDLLQKTISRGFVFSPEVVYNYSDEEINRFIDIIEKEIGLSAEKMNSSFHKSWGKVKDSDITQLVIEQLIHYYTTYGFERLGIYDESSVYIPKEDLDISELEENPKLVVIKGYTKTELKEKLLNLLESGIALGEETRKDILEVALFVDFGSREVERIRNKEVKIVLYDILALTPYNPIEFLRYVVYNATGKTLLIKDSETINKIKESDKDLRNLFRKYSVQYGFKNLAQIFYRYKPIFLALKHKGLGKEVNHIRKLAKKFHTPIREDYLNEVTAKINSGEGIKINELNEELRNVNTFRKIRLAYALKYRTKDTGSILYRIRNGKGYATEFSFDKKNSAKRVLDIVIQSIVRDVKRNIKGKKIYLPDNIVYSLPATEKQFTGDFPSGSYVVAPKDMIFGINWQNVGSRRIDLDLSLITKSGKIGWDRSYRTEERDILFSGDMTDAPEPNGASELFYVRKQKQNEFILMVNYYNYNDDIEVPFKIVVAQEEAKNFGKNYMVNPNNVLSIAKTSINKRQKVLGLLVTTTNECRFYFTEAYLGNSISSSESDFVENTREYLFNFYKNAINLNEILERAGAKIVKDREKADIDLSPENLEKDKIINLLR